MSQAASWSVPLNGPVGPTLYSQRVDESLDALLSSHSGSSRPPYAEAGTEWLSNATAGKLKRYLYDGTNDTLISTLDVATGKLTFGASLSDDALAAKAPKSVFASKNAGYTAVAADAGATIRFTAAATLALAAAGSLGNGWLLEVVTDGGPVTIDPNGTETINGLATWVIPNGSIAQIICDGSNFFLKVKPVVWEPVQGGVFSGAGASSFALTNLGAYARFRITGTMYASASGVAITMQTSTNNGSNYDGGVSDYTYQYFVSSSTTNGGVAANAPGLQIVASSNPNANDGGNVDVLVSRFNTAEYMQVLCRGGGQDPANIYLSHVFGRRNQATARNAFRLLPSSGTFTYNLKIEGSLI
ncbi:MULTISPECIES: hypothetical protein [unclassified Rhizobium]|uniref:hypothetical protein n=1 Tax=unclassified Rhizobium TaxID=2613769 RepID=UPI001ADA0951|nr:MULTISPECIES: hypothetical protein [unclassified Rhizobium]MBO9124842.1 hypothetical protein [Rhizobium sp. 16-488-2b]MBO9175426.1 hypothetical protein [Rhizobium sp. 16-488-2a]